MELRDGELKMLGKFRMYIKITNVSCATVCHELNITQPTFRTIMKNWKYIPQKRVRDKINLFMDHKLKELKPLVDC